MTDTGGITWATISGRDGCDDAFPVRCSVFVEEQGIPADEVFDGLDEEAVHIIGYSDGFAVSCARCVDEGGGRWRIGWVATRQAVRGAGLGTQAMNIAFEVVTGLGGREVVLSAQGTATSFYESLGFNQCGVPEELPSGFVLIPMRRVLDGRGGSTVPR